MEQIVFVNQNKKCQIETLSSVTGTEGINITHLRDTRVLFRWLGKRMVSLQKAVGVAREGYRQRVQNALAGRLVPIPL